MTSLARAADVGLCTPTLVRDLTRCSIDDLDSFLGAAQAAGTPWLDVFASHCFLAASGMSVPPPAGGAVTDTVATIRATNIAGAEAADSGDLQSLSRRIADAGCEVAVVEFLSGWSSGPGAETRAEAIAVCDLAATVGARLVVAASVAPTVDRADAADGLAFAADVAAERDLQLAVEWLPGTGIDHIAVVDDLIRRCGRANVGFLLDTLHWHFEPGGPDWATLDALAPERVVFVQVSDGAAADVPPGAAEPGARRLPGTGELELARLVDVLADRGARPLVASEVFNRPLLAELGVAGLAVAATDATRTLLSRS